MTFSAFLSALRFELRLLRRDAAAWAVLAAITTMSALAFFNGEERVLAAEGPRSRTRVAQRRNARLAARQALADMDAGRCTSETRRFGIRATLSSSASARRRVAALEPAPLAFVASGRAIFSRGAQSDQRSKDSFLFADEIENPAHLSSGSIDLAFVLVFRVSAGDFALCFDLAARRARAGHARSDAR